MWGTVATVNPTSQFSSHWAFNLKGDQDDALDAIAESRW